MKTFCITKTPIDYGDKVKIVLLASNSTYKGKHFQGFIANNECFKVIGFPFDAVNMDKCSFDVDEEDEVYKFTIEKLKKLIKESDENDKDFSWKNLEKLMHKGKMFLKEKDEFVNFMVISKEMYDMFLTTGKIENHLTEFKSENFKKLKTTIEKLLSEKFAKFDDLKDREKSSELSEKEKISLMSENFRLQLNISEFCSFNFNFLKDNLTILEARQILGVDKTAKELSEIFFVEALLNRAGNIFMPMLPCDETYRFSDAMNFNLKLAKKQLELEYLRNDEAFPFKLEINYSIKRTEIIEKLLSFSVSKENFEKVLEELKSESNGSEVFKLKLNKENKEGLLRKYLNDLVYLADVDSLYLTIYMD